MKKILMMACVCVLCMMIPMMALAVSQTEWDQQCRMKTNASVTLYSREASGTDIGWKAVATLGEGDYVKSAFYNETYGMWEVSYFNGSGASTAYAKSNVFVLAVSYVDFDDGDRCDVPEALMKDQEALIKYLEQQYSGYTFTHVSGTLYHKTRSASAGSSGGTGTWKTLKQQAEEAAAKLKLDLDDLQMALVYAPRTGQASLRQRAAGNGKVIDKLMDGTVVYIVEEGSKFSQVLANGMTGYIINSALEMVDADQLPLGEGELHYNGKTDGRKKIDLRCDPGTKNRKITQWASGTEVIVWSVSEDEKWYEVEYDGVRLYVQAEYLTITELYDEEESEDEEQEEKESEEEEEESAGGWTWDDDDEEETGSSWTWDDDEEDYEDYDE